MKTIRYIKVYILATMLFAAAGLLWTAPVLADDGKALVKSSILDTAVKKMANKWGIQVTAVRTAAAGNMVDFRYKVLDAEKAEALFSKRTKPFLVHQKTGKVLEVPRTAKVGPLMSSYRPQQDRIYWMFFGNQSKLIRPGDMVSVVIGDFKVENLKVQ